MKKRRTRRVQSRHIISDLRGKHRFFRFRKPIEVLECEIGGAWAHCCALLSIHASGETRDESWKAFIDFVEADWDLVAQSKDSKLTKGAQQLKRKYLEIVESVELTAPRKT